MPKKEPTSGSKVRFPQAVSDMIKDCFVQVALEPQTKLIGFGTRRPGRTAIPLLKFRRHSFRLVVLKHVCEVPRVTWQRQRNFASLKTLVLIMA